MAEYDDVDPNEQSGGALREKLEESIGREQHLAGELAAYKAADIITQKGYMYVQPDDLAKVPLDQIESKAQALQEERAKVFEGVVRRQLEQAGVTGEDLDRRVRDFLTVPEGAVTVSETVSVEDRQAFDRAKSLGTVGSPAVRNPETMSASEKIRFALSK